ncbi:MAG: 2-C-methyl-D-erythritol 2,4-cyclodiphosphate synthase [Bacteroidota bacterium]|nr:2-C-methyl-D-erythritol 2,4-cyclodiphosphate synthase [Candidatus Kapabacteria bacterium]MDW8220290.1 2-C-methyl-D-erythritol 2,4-cyclodiphosphate synthase [Bacteroidota bacterium]
MIGFGYDIHRLAEGETLILGGIEIPSSFGTVAHSDGDVLIHALCDALLGAAGLGDIGEHFPDTDPRYRGISSIKLLRQVVGLLQGEGYTIVNIDCTLVLERPKILPYKAAMRSCIAEACGIALQRVSIKATTSEKLGFVGAGEGVEAYAICQLTYDGTP